MSTQWDLMLKKIGIEFENNPKNFLKQQMISRTMHPAMSGLAEQYYRNITIQPEYKVFLEIAKDPSRGNPTLIRDKYSLSTLQQIYYIQVFEKFTGILMPDFTGSITDIGGGYGNQGRILKSLGFKGLFRILDLPMITKIQKYYLENQKNIEFSELTDKGLTPPNNNSILIGSFSINEMPMKDRNLIESHYNEYKYILIAHNRSFDGIDNLKYFSDLESRLSDKFEMTSFECPIYNRSRFLIGVRK